MGVLIILSFLFTCRCLTFYIMRHWHSCARTARSDNIELIFTKLHTMRLFAPNFVLAAAFMCLNMSCNNLCLSATVSCYMIAKKQYVFWFDCNFKIKGEFTVNTVRFFYFSERVFYVLPTWSWIFPFFLFLGWAISKWCWT